MSGCLAFQPSRWSAVQTVLLWDTWSCSRFCRTSNRKTPQCSSLRMCNVQSVKKNNIMLGTRFSKVMLLSVICTSVMLSMAVESQINWLQPEEKKWRLCLFFILRAKRMQRNCCNTSINVPHAFCYFYIKHIYWIFDTRSKVLQMDSTF